MINLNINDNVNDILREYYKYLLNNDLYNQDNNKYIFKLIKELYLNDYIKYYSILSNTLGKYSQEEKQISINVASFSKYPKQESIINYLIILLHEINHALQQKDLIEYNNKNILLFRELKSKLNYFKYHNYFPLEIDSILYSNYLIYIFSLLNKDLNINNELLLNKLITVIKETHTYEDIIVSSPISIITHENNINFNIENLTTLESIYYGLPINKEIYLELINLINNKDQSFIKRLRRNS